MVEGGHGLLAGTLELLVTPNTTGLETTLAAKLTGAERVAVRSADRVSTAVGSMGAKAQVATLRATAAQESYNRLLRAGEQDTVRLARAQAQLITAQSAVRREQERANSVSTRPGGLGAAGLIGGAAGLAATAAAAQTLRTGIREISDAQAGLAQTQAAIKSTGGAAHITATEVGGLASRIQSYSGYTDDAVVASENLLLTFTQVRNEAGKGNDIFNRATVAAADLARRGFGDLESNAKSLGKALSDPIAGLTALRRAGITFTDAQRAQIKALVDSNDLLGAQRLVLDELNREVGGSARAYGQTLPGQVDRAHRAFEDLSQGLVSDLEPALRTAADLATGLAHHRGLLEFALGAAGVVGGLALASKAVKSYREISDTLFSRGRVAEKVGANAAIAESYNAVASAATRAAGAETLAADAGAGAVGAGAAAGSRLRTATSAAGSAAAKGLVALPFGYASFQLTKAFLESQYPTGLPWNKQRTVGLGPATEAALRQYGGPEGLARHVAEMQADATGSATAIARDATVRSLPVNKATTGVLNRMNLDPFAGAPVTSTDTSGARAAVGEAQRSARDASASVRLAQERLDALRSGKSKASALQLASAEDALRRAKERSAAASDKANAAEAKASTARTTTALNATDLLKRVRGTERYQRELGSDEKALARRGAGPALLQQLQTVEQQNAGTIHELAQNATRAQIREMSRNLSEIRIDQRRQAAILSGQFETIAKQNGAAYAKAWLAAVSAGLTAPDLPDPGPIAVPRGRGAAHGYAGDDPRHTSGAPTVSVGQIVLTGTDAHVVEKSLRTKRRLSRATL